MCTGATGHVEVYDFTFEGGEKAYEDLVKHFFMFHDPTTLNRQGNDRGTQYASAIFTYDEKQVPTTSAHARKPDLACDSISSVWSVFIERNRDEGEGGAAGVGEERQDPRLPKR